MRLDELVNENYNKLNENDLLIWQYIQKHKKECCSISIEELAKSFLHQSLHSGKSSCTYRFRQT